MDEGPKRWVPIAIGVAAAAAVAVGVAVWLSGSASDPVATPSAVEAATEIPQVPSPVAADPTAMPTDTPEPAVVPTATPELAAPVSEGIACVLRLHGNNGSGGIDPAGQINGPYYADGEITLLDPISPTITAQNTWWEFDGPYGATTDDGQAYSEIRDFLTDYVDGFDCGPILVWGLSGGATMAAKLYCQGEDFDGRAWGFYFADPPMDESVLDCEPPDGVRTWLVQSEEFITSATLYVDNDGGLCPVAEWGWYCENGRALVAQDYYENLGIEPLSVVGSHLEALLAGTPSEFNMWDQLETWWAEYDPSRF